MLKRCVYLLALALGCGNGTSSAPVGPTTEPGPGPDGGASGVTDLGLGDDAGVVGSDDAGVVGPDDAGVGGLDVGLPPPPADMAGPHDLAMRAYDFSAPPYDAGPATDTPVIVPRTNINASLAPGAQTGADIAVDPTNTPYFNHLLAASDDAATGQVSVYETNDGATNWRTHKLILPLGGFAGATRQPTVAYDSQGNALVSFIVSDAAGTDNRIAVARRLAGAGSFARAQVVTSVAAERQRLAVDRHAQSPYLDTVYLAWTAGAGVFVAVSTDGGASFGQGVQVNDDGTAATSPYLTTARDGAVYLAWLDVGRGQLRIDRSSDRGATWGTDHVMHQLTASGTAASTIASPQSGARLGVFCDVDRTTLSRRGWVYCAYHDATAGNGLDVFLRHSGDGGATWSPPQRLNDDAPGVAVDQFLPRVQIDDGNAKVNVAWYDTRDDAAHVRTNVYFTRANDGARFAPAAKVTTALTDESRAGASAAGFGESLGLEAFLGRCRVLWVDSRTGDEDLFSAIIDFAHFNFFIAGSSTLTTTGGGAAQMSITVQSVSGYTAATTLSLLGLPAGASAGFSTNPVPPDGTSTLTVVGGSAAPGTYTVGLHGQGAGEQDTRNFQLVVQ